MRSLFQFITSRLYVRTDISRGVEQDILCVSNVDMSVICEPMHEERKCQYCLARQIHSGSMHRRTLNEQDARTARLQQSSLATMPPDVQRGKHIVASLPWPVKRARNG